MNKLKFSIVISLIFISLASLAQPGSGTKWTPDGKGFYMEEDNAIVKFDLLSQKTEEIISAKTFKDPETGENISIKNFVFTPDEKSILIYANSQKVWRYETRGDYYLLERKSGKIRKLGKGLPVASLMFAKISPDGKMAAYVSERNIYVEEISTGKIKALTNTAGKPKVINGTFDWAYEEEFSIYDGFRWSADSKKIAYWQIDATDIKYFNMINNTNGIYAEVVPIEYPKVGEAPSACKIGVVDIKKGKTLWMKIPGDAKQNYIPRMEWAANADELMIQQLDRKQQVSKIMYLNAKTGDAKTIYEEKDNAWVDVRVIWHDDNPCGWEWINNGQDFLWVSDKDGWTHVYKVSRDGKNETLVTAGEYDVIEPLMYDKNTDYLYFTASPENPTQKYLFRVKVNTKSVAERITPYNQAGTHTYNISADGKYAQHLFTNYYTPYTQEWISLPDHKALDPENNVNAAIKPANKAKSNVEFFTISTQSGVEITGWMAKPSNFDPTKKYPAVFFVYGEPAGMTTSDTYAAGKNRLYSGSMADDGYIYVSVDGRGSPAPKGVAWRKAIYKNIGILNIKDQAEAAMKLMEMHGFIDKTRIAVHGWSGGGSSTLNLLFKYPEVYQTGIAVAAVANQLTYDNIYQERYMGVPPEDLAGFIEGSPITNAKNLKGNLLYIHGTGDDNVHYQNAEMLINELVKHNKQFQFMAYPNRAHGLREGEGTTKHLQTLFTNYLKEHCPPGARD